MKFCENCGIEIGGKDYENCCEDCEQRIANGKKRKRGAKLAKKLREQAMSDLGLVKVKGACGGTYWE